MKVADDGRAQRIIDRLKKDVPDAHCELTHESPYQLLVATILSAQCTDERVNVVTPKVFARYPTPEHLAGAEVEELKEIIRSTGFFNSKARSLVGMARGLVERHGGEVPDTLEELTQLPGVGRKTANVLLGNCFGKPEGLVVDTHVRRLSARMGLTAETDPDRIEEDLSPRLAREDWTVAAHLLIWHGRYRCTARAPDCPNCSVAPWCPSDGSAQYAGPPIEKLIGKAAAKRLIADEVTRGRKNLPAGWKKPRATAKSSRP